MLNNINIDKSVIVLPVSIDNELILLDWVVPYLSDSNVINALNEFSEIDATHLFFDLNIVDICFVKALYIENNFVHIDLINFESTLKFFSNPDPFPYGDAPVAIANMFHVENVLIDQRVLQLLTEYNEQIFEELVTNNPVIIFDHVELTAKIYDIFQNTGRN